MGWPKAARGFRQNIPSSEKNGENWELADLPDDKSIIEKASFLRNFSDQVVDISRFQIPL